MIPHCQFQTKFSFFQLFPTSFWQDFCLNISDSTNFYISVNLYVTWIWSKILNLQIKKFNRMYFNSLTLIAILGVALTVLVILNHFWTTLYCVATDSTWLESLFIRFVEQINFVKLHGRNSWGNRISHFKFRENALLEKLLSIWHRA